MSHRHAYDVTILNGTAVSADYADCQNRDVTGIEMPAAWTSASLSFDVCSTPDGTFGLLHDDAGNHFEVVCAAGDRISLGATIAAALHNWRYVKVHSTAVGVPTTDVNQGADRIVRLILGEIHGV